MSTMFFPIQWLVKKALETREEMGDSIRAFSIYQFNKKHEMPEVSPYIFTLFSVRIYLYFVDLMILPVCDE